MSDWVKALQLVAFGGGVNRNSNNSIHNGSRSVTPPSLDSNGNQVANNHHNQELSSQHQEENLLYSSVDAPEVYRVRVVDSDASIRCGIHSESNSNHSLVITSVSISLAEDGKVLYAWPYRHIRRYGCT